ncbi:MAG: polymer-forming cytoskeletal protein [Polyangiaceae bacterium]|nr:polymer-forming cytoskeletal protein [Polyangiaceae bacterium]
MAANGTKISVIARAARVRGRLTGEGDLEIAGFVDGEVRVAGEVIVAAEGLVAAPIHARRVVVRGAVKGDLVGEDAIVLEPGARVVGDLRAPRIAVAEGALVRGYVQISDAGAAVQSVARATVGRAASKGGRLVAAPPPPRILPAVQVAQARVIPRAVAAPVEAPPSEVPEPVSSEEGARAALRRPPPPVVPALKKMRGQIVKKRER